MPPLAGRTSSNALVNTFRGTDRGSGGYSIPEFNILHLPYRCFLLYWIAAPIASCFHDPTSPQLAHIYLLYFVILLLHPMTVWVIVLALLDFQVWHPSPFFSDGVSHRTVHRARCSTLALLIPVMYYATPRPVSMHTLPSCTLSPYSCIPELCWLPSWPGYSPAPDVFHDHDTLVECPLYRTQIRERKGDVTNAINALME
jgi:hypothetical protein